MFEKIFGIFRKRKRADVSQEIQGEDMFGTGETGFEEDFEADTISLETGMSDSDFASSGGARDSTPDFGERVSATQPPIEDELGPGFDTGEYGIESITGEQALGAEAPISPPPEVEPYEPPTRKRGRIKGILATVAVVIIGLAGGFFGAEQAIETAQKLLTPGPTPAEQLAQVQQQNSQLESQLTAYRAVGTIEDIVAARDEIKKRSDLNSHLKAVEAKIARRPSVEKRLDTLASRLDRTERELIIQRGSLGNVMKAVKQIEARNKYLISTADKNAQDTEILRKKAEIVKVNLDPELIEKAESSASMHTDIKKGLEQKTSEALPSS